MCMWIDMCMIGCIKTVALLMYVILQIIIVLHIHAFICGALNNI